MDGSNIYGFSYSGTPSLGLQAPAGTTQPTDAGGGFNPNYSLASPGASLPNVGSPGGQPSTTASGSKTSPWGYLGAGLAAYGAYRMGGGGGGNVNLDPTGMGAQATAEAKNLWDRYNKGEMMPGDEAAIARWEQQQVKAKQDYYAKAGLSDSSMAKEDISQVGVHAQSMRMQANQALLQPAIQATGLADQYAQRLVNYQIMQDQQKQQAQQQFMTAVGTIAMMAL